MTHYIGIDLGTTNSVICSYDGLNTRIWKSPEENDVTPSAIYIDRRGRRYMGQRAYDSIPKNPRASATLFKRFMGSNTNIEIPAAGQSLSPEECSAEILKLLFSYLPEEIRQQTGQGTVVTVPAAFNQMQKEATLVAAEMADLGRVALMQEPVAAVMTALKHGQPDGSFLIYDFGGGTLDLAVAASHGGRVNLLAHGGLSFCGGRDFDRIILDKRLKPWLLDNFDLPENFLELDEYRGLARQAAWAAEKAKISLSGGTQGLISITEDEIGLEDKNGQDIYLDLTIERDDFKSLISERLEDTMEAVNDVIASAGLSVNDINQILFIGGPTKFKPLRDAVREKISLNNEELQVNPMTAVAEGAAIFAESLDWSTQSHNRKSARGQWTSGEGNSLTLNYQSRTPRSRARVVIIKPPDHPGRVISISAQGGEWTTGCLALDDEIAVELNLESDGENRFSISVFDAEDQEIYTPVKEIIISKIASVVDSIPASHSVGVEALESFGKGSVLDYLVRAGDPLPKKGRKVFKAAVSIEAGSSDSLNFKLWEGDIEEPISDNRSVGVMKVTGRDIDSGRIPAGGELVCDYLINDSGNISMKVSVPSAGVTLKSGRNFYSHQESQMDLRTAASLVINEASSLLERVDQVIELIDDHRLHMARRRLFSILDIDVKTQDLEKIRQAQEDVMEARRLFNRVRSGNLGRTRQLELDDRVFSFNCRVREYALPSEVESFEKRAARAQKAIETNSRDFEEHLIWIRNLEHQIMWRQDFYVRNLYARFSTMVDISTNPKKYKQLVIQGEDALNSNQYDKLRRILRDMDDILMPSYGEDPRQEVINIFRGMDSDVSSE